jgi:hypothetical protein
MKRWIRMAAALYPRVWRERYGEEFQTLLEDVDPGWLEFTDVMWGALKMQMSTATSYLKIAGATAAAGAMVAAAASFGVPRQYVSEAVVQMTSQPDVPGSPNQHALDNSAAYQFGQITSGILGSSSLAEIIWDPSLDLYREERQRLPMEAVILQMQRDTHISPSPMPPAGGCIGPPLVAQPLTGVEPFRPSNWESVFTSCAAFSARISFAYPDREKAQEVVRWLVTRFTRLNSNMNANRSARWRTVWPQSDPVPPGVELAVLDPASPPKPVSPNRLAFAACGLGAGLLLGLSAASLMRRPRWTFQMAGFAAAGCALAVALSFLVPVNYTSTAVLSFIPPLVPSRLSNDVPGVPTAQKFQQMEQEVLSRDSLARIIQKPSLDLYPKKRAHMPIEDVVDKMRSHDLSIRLVRPAPGPAMTFSISFSYPDRYKASRVVRELVARFEFVHFHNLNSQVMDLKEGNDVRTALEHKLGVSLEVLEPASLPEIPSGPGRLTFIAAGLAFGLLAGALTMRFRQHRGTALQPA